MLDTPTKRRIDDCRDILVGKLPDPKSQIEQITIALIYKFMNDMDRQNQDLGGEAKFFTGDFEKYSWDNLFDSKVTSTEMLNLYMKAIEKMELNPNIPELFRSMFKNAYLPYRDPETLRLFLKTIGKFEYTHSEKLGDAFEYLLSVMGSQGDAGQFRTPRHIIDFIVEVVDPGKKDRILDPACGTAGFLISAYNHIRKKNNNEFSPDEKKRLIENSVGYDISPDMVRLSLVNLYLHQFSDPHIYEYDTLSSEERWNENFDVILANPPFMSPKGGIKPHKKFSIQSNRAEVLFVDYIIDHLTPNGKAGVIVPEGIIFQSNNAYTSLRKKLLNEGLWSVISLPSGVFNPYSGVKTSILLIDKDISDKTDAVLFVKIENDGYGLGAQRKAQKGSQLPIAIEELNSLRNSIIEGSELSDTALINSIKKEKIVNSGDYSLSGQRYKALEPINTIYKTKTLEDVCELFGGGTPSRSNTDYWKGGDIPWISSKYFDEKGRISGFENITKKGLENSSTKIAPKGSLILISRVSVGKYAIADRDYAINQDLTAVIPKNSEILDPQYLYILGQKIASLIEDSAEGLGVRGVKRNFISSLQIPVPPLKVQKEIINNIKSKRNEVVNLKKEIEKKEEEIANHISKIWGDD